MATLKTTNIQHPDSPTPQIAMTADSMTFDSDNLTFLGSALDLPNNTTVDGNVIITQNNLPSSQYKSFSLFLSGM